MADVNSGGILLSGRYPKGHGTWFYRWALARHKSSLISPISLNSYPFPLTLTNLYFYPLETYYVYTVTET